MAKSKYAIALCAITSLHLFGQFMDPELTTPRSSSTVIKRDEFFPEIIPEHGRTERRVTVIEKDICIISNNVSELKKYVDFQDSSVKETLSSYTDSKCDEVYIKAVVDAETNANIVSEAAIVHCVNHSDMNKQTVLEITHSNDTNVLTLAKRYTDTTVDDLRGIHSNDIIRLNQLIDSKEVTLLEIISNSVTTLDAKIDSEKKSLIETIDLRADQLDERINTVSGELSKKIENSTNEVLRVAKVYADQYANLAPGYAETQSKANAALPNTYNSMIGSDSFVRAVRDTIGEFPVVVKTLKSMDQRTGSSLPSTIIMNAGKDVIYYTGLTSNSLSLSFSNTDANEDGVYTWELMLSTNNDISGTTCGESVSYVGNDRVTNPSLSFKRIDNERTTHVFAVRLIKIGTVQKWMIAYNYSFKG